MSGKLRVVSDDRSSVSDDANQETPVQATESQIPVAGAATQESVATFAQKDTLDRSFGFDGLFNPDDVEDDTDRESVQQPLAPSPFANQDASAFSRSSGSYGSHKKHGATSGSSRAGKPSKRTASMGSTRVRGAEQSSSTSRFDAVDPEITPDRTREANTSRAARKQKPKKSIAFRVVTTLIALLVIAGVALGGAYFWDKYLRYDDAADFQGTWYFQEGAVEVTIDETHINLPENLHYAYTMDTWAKTISLSFADLTGGGSYEFSEDRLSIVIYEGEGSDATSLTLMKAPEPEGEGTADDKSTNSEAQATDTGSDADESANNA